MNTRRIALKIRNKIVEHSPTILALLSVAGVGITAVLASKATLSVDYVLYDYERQKNEALTKKEKFTIAWKYYIPTGIAFVATGACIIGSNAINTKRQIALASAYSLANEAFKDYRAQVAKTIGDNKEQKIRDEVNQQKVLANPAQDGEIVHTGNGETKCYIPLTDRYFYSDIEAIRQAVNNANEVFLQDGYGSFMSVNDLYYELGLPNSGVGDMMGWHLDTDGQIKVDYTSVLDERGTPCLCINFQTEPRYITGS